MAVTIHVNGKSNSLAHKGCMGITKSTIPDVCKTPTPGGPVPIPYPIIVSMSSDLKKGTKTVKVDGKKMAAIKGSEYSRCTGDEPGTVGGVKSSTNMKEATWILYSFDVKLDGKNACRLSDKMMMNHGNTACLSGTIHKPVIAGQFWWDQTCLDETREKRHANMKEAQEDVPETIVEKENKSLWNMGTKKKNKHLEAKTFSCDHFQERVDKLEREKKLRNELMEDCFAADLDSNNDPLVKEQKEKEDKTEYEDALKRRGDHEKRITAIDGAIKNTKKAMSVQGC